MTERATPARASERGAALILALLLAAAFVMLGASLLSGSVNSSRVATNEQSSARAFSIAEAGIERARVALATTKIDQLLTSGGTLFAGQSLDAGTYGVAVTNNLGPRFPLGVIPIDPGGTITDTDGYLLVNSTGTLGTAQRRIEVIFKKTIRPIPYAVWTNTSGTFGGPSYTDSYDSSVGPYATTVNSNGNAFSNGDLTMNGGSQIRGSAQVVGTVDSGHVTGTATTGVPPQTQPNLSCPLTYTAAANVSNGHGANYDPATGVLTVNAGGDVTITAPPNTIFFKSIKLNGNSTMTIAGGSSHVDMYVSNSADLSGGTLINPSGVPSLLTIAACGPATDSWKITGGANAAFVVYAPTRDVSLVGGAPIFGAVIANTLSDSGGAAVHYDQALDYSPLIVVSGSWGEIYQ